MAGVGRPESEVGRRRQEAGGRRQEAGAGGRRQEQEAVAGGSGRGQEQEAVAGKVGRPKSGDRSRETEVGSRKKEAVAGGRGGREPNLKGSHVYSDGALMFQLRSTPTGSHVALLACWQSAANSVRTPAPIGQNIGRPVGPG